ncbi:MAG: tRNA glutamyl-Q(34) synthetase GluQRS [Gallionellaceae bacterium]|jgi:glutamyl-Q tRNA(Asp) synthetase
MLTSSAYRGRFAPSPTGPLHFGSLVAALGSYLDAKHHHGIWLVRMEDLDTPRTVPGAADSILRTLECLGLNWDEEVIFQSRRTPAYEEAWHKLHGIGAVYPCACTRKEIADSALHALANRHVEELIYPGTCRDGIPAGKESRSWRVRTIQKLVGFNDALQGNITQILESESGDFVVKRADGLFAYQLAVVVDDAFQGITHVVRGADLIASTPRQIHLQHLLNLSTPQYMHLPVAVNAQNEKLSKQTLAKPVDCSNPAKSLINALSFLQQNPPAELSAYDVSSILNWAAANWDSNALSGIMRIPHIASDD